jgi:uncharacterized protein YutE (UPF0331/DUF86 family)
MTTPLNDERLAKLLTTAVEAMCDLAATLTDDVSDETAEELMAIRRRLLDALVEFTSE